MRNAIQHVRHHIATRNQTNKAERQEWTEEETTTRDCRIRTLQNHNPWKEKETEEERNNEKQPQEIQNDQEKQKQQSEDEHIDKNEQTSASKGNIWEKLGYVKQITNNTPRKTEGNNIEMPNK